MALALVWEEDSDEHRIRLGIDTGTSSYFRLALGHGVQQRGGLDRLSDVYWTSPWTENPGAGQHFSTSLRRAYDAALLRGRTSWVQVQSAREPSGVGGTFSAPLRLGATVRRHFDSRSSWQDNADSFVADPDAAELIMMQSRRSVVSPAVRSTAVRSAKESFSRPASLDDLLGAALRAALPALQQLVTGAISGAPGTSAPSPASTAPALDPAILNVLTSLLQNITGTGADAGAGVSSGLTVSAFGSWGHTRPLQSTRVKERSQPLIFGVDDALLASLAGPALSSLASNLPQLLNALGAARENERGRQQQLARDALAAAERMRLMQLLESAGASAGLTGHNEPAAAASTEAITLRETLLRLLQDTATVVAPSSGATATGSTPSATSPSASPSPAGAVALSRGSGVVLQSLQPAHASALALLPHFAQRPEIGALPQFVASRSVVFRFSLEMNAAAGAVMPRGPLPRAILTLSVREPGSKVDLFRVEQRLNNVQPATEFRCEVPAEEVKRWPVGAPLDICATIRWPGNSRTLQATSTSQISLNAARNARPHGTLVGERRELTDMGRFRSFWNRVWSYEGTSMWGLNAKVRYSIVLSGRESTNALMTTRAVLEDTRPGLREESVGRIKSGLEVAVPELNKLLPLFAGHQELSDAELSAFLSPEWIAAQGGDTDMSIRFDGKKDTLGLLWAVPVISLRRFTVESPTEIDPFGQVLGVISTEVDFPSIDTVRCLGLGSSGDSTAGQSTVEGYVFEGYRVLFNAATGLAPAVPTASAARGDSRG